MSFFGIGRPAPTAEQKIAAVESEMRMMAETYNRYVPPRFFRRRAVPCRGGAR